MVSPTQYPVLTVGHSNHAPDAFIKLLIRHGVDEVADVRSAPYSRYAPHFNHDALPGLLAMLASAICSWAGSWAGGPPTAPATMLTGA